jgi:hypothetical protein
VPLALSQLSAWDNIDKHRVLHAVLLGSVRLTVEVAWLV